MAVGVSAATETARGGASVEGRATTVFHLAATSLIVALNVGAYVDARAHIHEGFSAHSFFVPTHWGLHGAWLGICALIVVYALRGSRAGLPRSRWLPVGYGVTALGALTWGIGGAFDILWHSLFGLEVNVETVYNPAHLALLASSALMMLGVIRHSLHERSRSRGDDPAAVELPLVIGIAALLQAAMWLTWYSDPLTDDFAAGGALVRGLPALGSIQYVGPTSEIAGITGITLNSLVLMLFVIWALYRLRLPVGAVTFIVSYYVLFRAWAMDTWVYAPAFIVGAAVGDVLWAGIRRRGESAMSSAFGYRLIGALVPALQIALYMATIAWAVGGIVWVVHLWVGAIVLGSVAGLAASFVLIQPAPSAAIAR